MLTDDDILAVFDILEEEFSSFEDTELKYDNNYQLLVAVMLSAQATDFGVNKVTKKLFPVLKSPEDAIKLGIDGINNYIRSINYHNVKAKHIFQMSQQIISQFNNKIPCKFEELILLKGVGRKTANVFLSVAFKKNTIAVDTHVFRVSNRIGIVKAKTPLETEIQLANNVPTKKHRKINPLLIQFGRQYCKAKNPKCSECPIKKYCKYCLSKKIKIKTYKKY